MNIYIRSAACISPKNTTGDADGLPPLAKPATTRLTCLEPDYKTFIDPKALRRMSRIIRMGVATARQCLQDANLAIPDAIVTGTGYGCLEDTGLFMKNMIQRNEDSLQPAQFIQSTHNTVGAQIALLLQCTGYNNTFVHRGFSFESALLDSILLLKEQDASTVLVGGVDELTADSYAILSRFGLFRHMPAGEGTAFFLLTGRPSGEDYAQISGMTTIYKPKNREETLREVYAFLQEHAVEPSSIDLVIGDEIIPGKPTMAYKTQCGEYPTSSAYALWLAAQRLKTGPYKRILVYNQYLGIHHAAFLLSKA